MVVPYSSEYSTYASGAFRTRYGTIVASIVADTVVLHSEYGQSTRCLKYTSHDIDKY